MAEDIVGKHGRSNREIERKGVRAAQGVFEDAGYLFQEVELHNDIGKDAYVDLAENDRFAGEMIAIQVKAGEKYRRSEDYKIPCSPADLAVWRGSPVPIVGVVYDSVSETLHWVDLTAWANNQPKVSPPTSCPVDPQNLLCAATLDVFVQLMRRRLRELAEPAVLDLAAQDPLAQSRAVWDCWALGRRDARALLLLRASLRWLADVDASWPAIHVLSLATPHSDVFWSSETRLPEDTIARLSATFRWSVEEAELLLAAPAPDMWDRGNLGQSVYMLLVADPDHERLLRSVVEGATDVEIAWTAARILVSLAGEAGLAVLETLTATSPVLQGELMVAELRQTLLELGEVSMF
jgi:hypothetical protein